MAAAQNVSKDMSYQQYRDSMNAPVESTSSSSFVIDNVRIIDGQGRAPLADGRVFVDGARIVAVGRRADVRVPDGVRTIDGSGCTVVPGLMDVHVHDFSDENLHWYVRNGVTTIRMAGGDQPSHRNVRARVERGEIRGPRIYSCGYMLDATPHAWPGNSYAVDSPAEARRVVRRAILDEKVDALIATTMITRGTLRVIVETAHEFGIPVTGQIWRCDVNDALEMRMDGLDNTSRIPAAADLPDDRLMKFTSVSERLSLLARLWSTSDPGYLTETAHRMADGGLTWAPEIVSFEAMAGTGDAALKADRDWPKDPNNKRALQYDWKNSFIRTAWSREEFAAQERAVERIKEFSVTLHRAGGQLAGGTDLSFGGILIHRELMHLVDAGLTPVEAIRVMSRQSASFLGLDDLGGIVQNATADLVLVRGDASKDLSALREVCEVWIGGRSAWKSSDDARSD
jgi:imidazolonepropionase-like amidohydrolase